jgi:acetyl esterase/lipase
LKLLLIIPHRHPPDASPKNDSFRMLFQYGSGRTLTTHFEKRAYIPVDAADCVSCRPDFAVALYPGHQWQDVYGWMRENPDIRPTKKTPPTFIVQAENDPVDTINNSLAYYIALKDADVATEMHLYAEGGHAFGLRRTKYPITRWPELMMIWLGTIESLAHSFGRSHRAPRCASIRKDNR